MKTFTIDLDDELADRLQRQASAAGRSVEAEIGSILISVAPPTNPDFWAKADELRRRSAGRTHVDSVTLLREDRDR